MINKIDNNINKNIFTIIIPVYNDEKRIDRCLNSLLTQNKYNFDVIIVNDGSIDNTSTHILKYIDKNSDKLNIKYINKKINAGVSKARNDALELVKTKYVFFLDSDDYINNETTEIYEELINKQNLDLYSFNYNVVYSDITKNCIYKSKYNSDKCFASDEYINELLMQKNGIYAHCCTKLYKNEIIQKNNIRFESDISFMEDLIFNLKFAMLSKNIIHINNSLYNYVQSDNSLSKSNNEKMIFNFKIVSDKVYELLQEKNNIKKHIYEYESMYNRLVILAIIAVIKSDVSNDIK
ncbi:MAG: glycosyltransferase, partial [Clostridia bacterium]